MKRWLLVFSAIGLVGCFLPLVAGISFWDFHSIGGWRVYAVIAAYLVPLVLVMQNDIAKKGGAILATACYGWLLYMFGTQGVYDAIFHAAIGGIMMGVGAVGGAVASARMLLNK